MKKIVLCFVLFFSFCLSAKAEKLEVSLDKCVDGDTAWVILNDEAIKIRFLAIDTPESTNKIEAFGKEASNFTCNLLTNAKKIEIEYDPDSDKMDKYDRHLVWVFVDDELLQNKIIENGYASVEYIYGDYLYTDTLENSLEVAKNNKVGMWKNEKNNYAPIIIIIGIIIVLCLFSSSIRNMVSRKAKSKIRSGIKKQFNKIIK